MATKIVKRNGIVVDFDVNKIKKAIYAAAKSVGGSDEALAEHLAKQVAWHFVDNDKIPHVEDVQDTVEKVLIKAGYADTAKAYILYRNEHAKAREMTDELIKNCMDITKASSLESDMKRENANINSDTAMGSMLKFGSSTSKLFSEKFLMNEEFANAHRNGDIHIHDLDFYSLTTTCCQISLEKLFKDGFSTGHGFLREPNDIQTYSALACIAIQSNQNDQHGGQSIFAFDYDMSMGVSKTYAKELLQLIVDFGYMEEDDVHYQAMKRDFQEYIKKHKHLWNSQGEDFCRQLMDECRIDKATAMRLEKTAYKHTIKRTYQAMEALIHNLNTMHSRAGAQVPFSSLNYGTDISAEGRLIIEQLLLATEAGLGHGETPIFPIQIFKVKDGVNLNPGDPNYDLFKLACRVSAKRLFPNFSFIDAPYNLQYYKPGHPETEIAYDIVNIGLHFFLKNVRPHAASCSEA